MSRKKFCKNSEKIIVEGNSDSVAEIFPAKKNTLSAEAYSF